MVEHTAMKTPECSLAGKPVSENPTNSAKPKSKDMATPSKEHKDHEEFYV